MQKVSEIIAMIEANKDNMEFLKTGFPTVDEKLDGGFLRKELVILGGQTGIGKSYIASQIMFNIARDGFKTCYFSLEISNEMLVSRLLGSVANLKSTRVRSGLLTLIELEQLQTAKGKVQAYEDYLSFYDNTYNFSEIKKKFSPISTSLLLLILFRMSMRRGVMNTHGFQRWRLIFRS